MKYDGIIFYRNASTLWKDCNLNESYHMFITLACVKTLDALNSSVTVSKVLCDSVVRSEYVSNNSLSLSMVISNASYCSERYWRQCKTWSIKAPIWVALHRIDVFEWNMTQHTQGRVMKDLCIAALRLWQL